MAYHKNTFLRCSDGTEADIYLKPVNVYYKIFPNDRNLDNRDPIQCSFNCMEKSSIRKVGSTMPYMLIEVDTPNKNYLQYCDCWM